MSNSIIYLRGIQSHEIESILQFIYLGEATFYQERMNEFLAVAKSLQVKEISKDIDIRETDDAVVDTQTQEYAQDNELPTNETKQEHNRVYIPKKDRQLKKCNENRYSCDRCNYKTSHLHHLQNHIKSIHEGVKFPCDQCNSKFTDPSSLRKDIKYPCDQCSYKATQMGSLRTHIRSFHS